MYVRVTPYQLKPGVIEAAKERANSLHDEVMALPGMIHFTNAVDETGKGYIIAMVESRAISDSNIPRVREIWAKMGEFLAAMPTPEGYDVVAHWKK